MSAEWQAMSPEEKHVWEEKSSIDKTRYEAEMVEYRATSGRTSKQPMFKDLQAPKRPMSAYLAYANSHRGELKKRRPDLSNGELSRLLSKQWKEAPPEVRAKYIEEEARLRAQYKSDIAKWRRTERANSSLQRKRAAVTARGAAEPEDVKTGQRRSLPQQIRSSTLPSADTTTYNAPLVHRHHQPPESGNAAALSGPLSSVAAPTAHQQRARQEILGPASRLSGLQLQQLGGAVNSRMAVGLNQSLLSQLSAAEAGRLSHLSGLGHPSRLSGNLPLLHIGLPPPAGLGGQQDMQSLSRVLLQGVGNPHLITSPSLLQQSSLTPNLLGTYLRKIQPGL